MTAGAGKWKEGVLIGALVAACVVLAGLQYRWMGEYSKAEEMRLYATANGRLEQLARAFDTELRQSVMGLVPAGEEVRAVGAERANTDRLRRALEEMERPVFRRVGAAVRERGGALRYLAADLKEEKFVAGEWPGEEEWQKLRRRLEEVARGEASPHAGNMVNPGAALIEVPVFVEEEEVEWMVFELDVAYVREKWLPELMGTYLNPAGDARFQMAVRWRMGGEMVFGEALQKGQEADAQGELFPVRYLERGRGRGRREGSERWVVEVAHVEGSVPAAVAAARRRNLGAALFLLVLIAAAGGALLHNTREARRLAAAQYQFFAGLSHELRTPLTVIQGAGHNLLSGVVKDEGQRESYLQAIVKQSTQLTEMVEQLLAYGAVRKGGVGHSGKAVLDVVVSEAIEMAAMELEQSGRRVDVDMPADLPAVRGDGAALRRVFGNLIVNAIRHGGGEVRVTAGMRGGGVEVRVADSGEGIPKEELQQVFEPFFRGARARSGKTRGTGLGLSLVKEIVEGAGGTVTVESGEGQGTAVVVKLEVAG